MASQAWSLEDCTSLTTQREESSLQQQTPEREHGPVRMPGAPGTAGVSTGRGVPGEPGGGANRAEPRNGTGGTPSDGKAASERNLHTAVGLPSWAGAVSAR